MNVYLIILSIIYGILSYWNYVELQLYKTHLGYKPIDFSIIPYLGGTFRNIGSPICAILLFALSPIPNGFIFIVGTAIGYFLSGMIWRALLPFSTLIGRYAIFFYGILVSLIFYTTI